MTLFLSQTVEKATNKLQCVTESNVNLATEKLTISYDENAISLQDIQSAVDKAGYKAISADTENKTFALTGMTCASCVQTIEKATRKLDGVLESNVNLATNKMHIQYDATAVSNSDIIEAVSNAGYEAHEDITSSESVDEAREQKEKEIKSLWKRFWISALFTAPLLYIAMGHLVGAPLPGMIDPAMSPEGFVIVQLLLTFPVVVVNRSIYASGFKTLFRGHPNMDARSEERRVGKEGRWRCT